jgi:L-malate glycosyltransferase
MKIAFIVPSLTNQGPVIVVRDIINELLNKVDVIDVYYFDDNPEINMPCNTIKIKFNQKIDFNGYDIIHSHMLRPDIYIWYHSKAIKKAKCISTLHQDIFQNLKSSYNSLIAFIFEKIWIKALKSHDVVVTLTQIMLNQYIDKISPVQLCKIYNGRPFFNKELSKEIDDIDKEKISNIKSKYKVIGVSALLTKRKGISQIIKALPYLDDFALVVIGDGKEKGALIKLSEDLKVTNKVLFLGYRFEAVRYYAFFDLYAMSSYSEGFPLSLLEAGNASLPTICSDIPIFRELFSDNEVSFFELDNTNSLVNAVLNLDQNAYIYSSNFYNKVNDSYSVVNMSENYLSLYNQ